MRYTITQVAQLDFNDISMERTLRFQLNDSKQYISYQHLDQAGLKHFCGHS